MSLVVRIIAPTGRDAQLTREVLQRERIRAEVCLDLQKLIERQAEEPIGPLLIAEEALTAPVVAALSTVVRNQPTWSDLPVLILTGSRHTLYDHSHLGTPILLERPIRTDILVSSVRAALRARERQYQVRDALHERDRAFAELRHEQQTLQAVLENMPVGVALAKPSGEIVFGNRELETIFRHPIIETQDIEAHGRWIAFHADGRRVRGEDFPLPRAMKSRRWIPAEEYLYQRGDGTLAWVSLTAAPILNEDGEVTGGIVAVTDIDRQKRSGEMLRLSEERFRRLIEHASVGVLIGDLKGAVSYVNPYLQRLLGYSEEETANGQFRWDTVTPKEYAEADAAAAEQLQATGTADPYQKAFRAKDGRAIPLLIGATNIPSERDEGKSEEVAVFLTDLSSQKKAELALLQSEKLAAVGRLAASISHEINNPLEAITNALYLLSKEDLGSNARVYLEMAEQQLNRVSQIVTQTLRFHRQATRPRSVALDELLAPVIGLYGGRLGNAGIVLELRHRDSPPVVCYEGEIRQVLNNLVGNAIDAMRSGGRLIIRTGPAVRWTDNTPGVCITLADTGHGMSPEIVRHIFEAFYTTKGINGTGLGLWISSEIVRKHNGRLQVRSKAQPGSGWTAFRLFLPTESTAA